MFDSLATSWRRGWRRSEPESSGSALSAVDRFSVFEGFVHIAGWVFVRGARVSAVHLCFPKGARFLLKSYGLDSADVANDHGAEAARVRFEEGIFAEQPQTDVPNAWLEVQVVDRDPIVIRHLGRTPPNDPSIRLHGRFTAMLKERQPGNFLEVGSRARSGIVRRHLVPDRWTYTGLDVIAGENVDVVGDAHKLSRLFPTNAFDAVAAFSVLEHLLMPWKFAIELNKVLRPGAIGFLTTHQTWPMHDTPWDFWRFSDTAWTALFNRATGFEIVETALGEPAIVLAARCHAATNFGSPPASFLASSVIFRKIGETSLDWPVEIEDVTGTHYPSAKTG